jgi:hypothetical protein
MVKGTIFGVQKDLMPGKRTKIKLKTNFDAEFADLVDGIDGLRKPMEPSFGWD